MPRNQRKSITLCARIDEPTHRQLKRAAEEAGMPLTDWVRTRLIDASEREAPKRRSHP